MRQQISTLIVRSTSGTPKSGTMSSCSKFVILSASGKEPETPVTILWTCCGILPHAYCLVRYMASPWYQVADVVVQHQSQRHIRGTFCKMPWHLCTFQATHHCFIVAELVPREVATIMLSLNSSSCSRLFSYLSMHAILKVSCISLHRVAFIDLCKLACYAIAKLLSGIGT